MLDNGNTPHILDFGEPEKENSIIKVIGVGGVFRDKFHNQPLEIALGAFLACALRYICHFISGWAVWKMWAPEGQPAWLYSVTYNATYMVPETIVTIVVGVLIALVLDFRKDTVGTLKRA